MKRFVSLVHLGANMWQKPGNFKPHNKEYIDMIYREKLVTDRDTWREVTDFAAKNGVTTVLVDMGEGVELKSHPELAVPGSWTGEQFREELKRLRANGLEVLPKFNFSCSHNAWMKDWGYKVGLPEYNAFCRDVINETCELFDGPELFHLGLDEEDPGCQEVIGQPVVISRKQTKKAEDANELFDACRKNGARPWMWADPFIINEFGGEKAFCSFIPKDVVMSNWFYNSIHNFLPDLWDNPHVALFKKLEDWGYSQIPTGSTWAMPVNMLRIGAFAKNYLDDSKLLGFMSASWLATVPELKYGILHDICCMKLAKDKYYPEG
ncbi:MAG: hypothetical protein IJV00_09820 [Clostridia bacterium]|nr:hypothetical protein [Clostridia bacterium]